MGKKNSPPLAPEPPQVFVWKPRWVVACGQMELRGDLERNRRIALEQIDEAARKHRARLIVLPETALSGYAPSHWALGCASIDFKTLAQAETDVRALARKRKIAVVVGTTTRVRKKFYNTALIIERNGRLAGRYDKLHLTGIGAQCGDAACFAAGERRHFKPLRVAGVKAGVQICFDMRFPETWRVLAMRGARVLLHCVAAFGREGVWKREPLEGTLSTRASENACWLASANCAGPFQYVSSRIIDPDGMVVTRAEYDAEQVISAAIDPDCAGRSGGYIPFRRTDSYRLERKF